MTGINTPDCSLDKTYKLAWQHFNLKEDKNE
jgi:hypothetical protein